MIDLKQFFEELVASPTTFNITNNGEIASYTETSFPPDHPDADFEATISVEGGSTFSVTGKSRNKDEVRKALLLDIVAAGLTYVPRWSIK